MKFFADISKSDFEGYPKTIYDDGDTKLQIWKFTGHRVECSYLTLLISKKLETQISKSEGWAVKIKIDGDAGVCLKPPCGMKFQVKNALQDERFKIDCEEDIISTDDFLIIKLNDVNGESAYDLKCLFDEHNVDYIKEQYNQFFKDWGIEQDKLKKAIYEMSATRPTHRNVKIIQTKLDELQACIETVEVNDDEDDSYEEAVKKLRDEVDNCFAEIAYMQENIPQSGATQEEDEALVEIEQRIKQLNQKRRQKLDELGYESPEDSRTDLFPNGEDED